MEYDLEKLVLDILDKHRQLFQARKDRYAPDDIADLYGVSVATARAMMNRGGFRRGYLDHSEKQSSHTGRAA